MKKYLIFIALVTAACGSSPTSPTSTERHDPPQAVKPVEPPAIVDPTPIEPVPAEPLPVPVPTPPEPIPAPPVPAPAAWVFDGTTDQAYWFTSSIVIPAKFTLVITKDAVIVEGRRFPLLGAAPDNVYVMAGDRNVETLTIEYHGFTNGSGQWVWYYDGQPGHAVGSLVRR